MTTVFSTTWQTFRLGLQASSHSLHTPTSLLKIAVRPPKFPKHPIPPRFQSCSSLQNARPSFAPNCLSDRARSIRTTSAFYRKSTAFSKARPTAAKSQNIPASLSQTAIDGLFGKTLSREEGNKLLAEVHQQRLEGTLDLKLDYPEDLVSKGLQYLRAKFPVDEDAAVIARVDREVDESERGFGLPQSLPAKSRYAQSSLEQLRKANRARNAKEKEEEERREAEDRAAGKDQTSKGLTAQGKQENGVQRKEAKEKPEWVKRYTERATEQKTPPLSTLRRVLPSGIVTALVVGLSIIFALEYTPAPRESRIFPNEPPAVSVMKMVVLANVAVFVLWRVPPMWRFLNRYFMIVPIYPRAASMLFAAFSHQKFGHLMVNMLFMWLVGVRLHDDMGRGPFLALMFSSAVLGSFVFLTAHAVTKILHTAAVGASGIAHAFLAASCIIHEGQTVTFPNVPAEWTGWFNSVVFLAVTLVLEITSLRRVGLQNPAAVAAGKAGSDYLAHLGGMATGIAAGWYVRSTDPRWQNVERHSFWNGRIQPPITQTEESQEPASGSTVSRSLEDGTASKISNKELGKSA